MTSNNNLYQENQSTENITELLQQYLKNIDTVSRLYASTEQKLNQLQTQYETADQEFYKADIQCSQIQAKYNDANEHAMILSAEESNKLTAAQMASDLLKDAIESQDGTDTGYGSLLSQAMQMLMSVSEAADLELKEAQVAHKEAEDN